MGLYRLHYSMLSWKPAKAAKRRSSFRLMAKPFAQRTSLLQTGSVEKMWQSMSQSVMGGNNPNAPRLQPRQVSHKTSATIPSPMYQIGKLRAIGGGHSCEERKKPKIRNIKKNVNPLIGDSRQWPLGHGVVRGRRQQKAWRGWQSVQQDGERATCDRVTPK